MQMRGERGSDELRLRSQTRYPPALQPQHALLPLRLPAVPLALAALADPKEENHMPAMKIDITADTSHIARTARIIAKHLTALAGELEDESAAPRYDKPAKAIEAAAGAITSAWPGGGTPDEGVAWRMATYALRAAQPYLAR
jgi:hypothetical protein